MIVHRFDEIVINAILQILLVENAGVAVAAIVYRRRTHVINLFIAPAVASDRNGAKIEKVQGFNIRRWNADGLEFWAVSDIDAEALQEFGAKFEAGLHEVGRT